MYGHFFWDTWYLYYQIDNYHFLRIRKIKISVGDSEPYQVMRSNIYHCFVNPKTKTNCMIDIELIIGHINISTPAQILILMRAWIITTMLMMSIKMTHEITGLLQDISMQTMMMMNQDIWIM